MALTKLFDDDEERTGKTEKQKNLPSFRQSGPNIFNYFFAHLSLFKRSPLTRVYSLTTAIQSDPNTQKIKIKSFSTTILFTPDTSEQNILFGSK